MRFYEDDESAVKQDLSWSSGEDAATYLQQFGFAASLTDSSDRPIGHECVVLAQEFRLKNVDILTFIQISASLLYSTPAQFQEFSSQFKNGYRVVYAVGQDDDSDEDTIDIITIITPANEGHIFTPRSSESESKYPKNTLELREYLNGTDVAKGLALLTRRWAIGMSELLQLELSNPSSPESHRRKCLRYLRELSRQHSVLPPSFLLNDLEKDGNYPIWGGGFADIWKGRMNTKPVCIKVLRLFTTSHVRAQLFKNFSNEALVWKQLEHPNVLPFLGVNTELFSPSFCLISPWMENGNVVSFLEKNPEHDRLGMLPQIAEGLSYLHNLNPQIIHGDIRGANIVVTPEKICCLADFGLALVTESQTFATTSTGMQGSVRWMAPEIIEPSRMAGREKIPSARDIYAFGCTILEIFTGKPPYADIRMEISVLTEILKGNRPPRPVDSAVPISDDLWDLIQDCWVDDPEYRPDAERLVQALTIRSRSQSRASNFAEVTEPSYAAEVTEEPLSMTLMDEHSAETFLPSVMPTELALTWPPSRRTSWLSKDSLSSRASSMSGVDSVHAVKSAPGLNLEAYRWRAVKTAPGLGFEAHANSQSPAVDQPVSKRQNGRGLVDPVDQQYSIPGTDDPESSSEQADLSGATWDDTRSLAPSNFNDLMYGVSHGFDGPAHSAVSLRSLEVCRTIPKDVRLRYGDYRPFHIQAPSWSQLLHLMKGHPETIINVDIPSTKAAHFASPSELKLRVVCQFFKPALARHWRSVVWLTIDYPLPRMRGDGVEEELAVKELPRSYSFSTSAMPALLQESTKNLSMHYTIPQTKNLPYPTLPISFPDLAIYLEEAMDQSRISSKTLKRKSVRRSWRRSKGIELLARMVDACEEGEPYYIPEWGNSFFKKLQHVLHIPGWGKTPRNAVVVQ